MKVKLLQVDIPTVKSGRIYPSNVIQHAIDMLKEKNPNYMLGVVEEMTYSPTLEASVGVLQNLSIEDGCLVGEVFPIENRMDKYKGVIINIRPLGIGETDENGIMKDGYIIVGGLIMAGPYKQD